MLSSDLDNKSNKELAMLKIKEPVTPGVVEQIWQLVLFPLILT
jgi:hypothetical protein